MALKGRLHFDASTGAIRDGERRYVLMRPDVVMGALHGLDADMRGRVLSSWYRAARANGARSLRAYAEQAAGDPDALIETTVAAACDLGWGRWEVRPGAHRWHLTVTDSPFAQGAGPAEQAVCAPVAGLLAALVEICAGEGAAVEVIETRCAAQGAATCEFEARVTAAAS